MAKVFSRPLSPFVAVALQFHKQKFFEATCAERGGFPAFGQCKVFPFSFSIERALPRWHVTERRPENILAKGINRCRHPPPEKQSHSALFRTEVEAGERACVVL